MNVQKNGDGFVFGMIVGLSLALLIGQLDTALALPWWRIILFAGGSIFGMFVSGLLIAWGIRRDDGQGVGISLFPGVIIFILIGGAAALASLGITTNASDASFGYRIVLVASVGITAFLTFVRSIQVHLD